MIDILCDNCKSFIPTKSQLYGVQWREQSCCSYIEGLGQGFNTSGSVDYSTEVLCPECHAAMKKALENKAKNGK